MTKVLFAFAAAALLTASGGVYAGEVSTPNTPIELSSAQLDTVNAGHAPGIARQIEPSGLVGTLDGTPAANGHAGVLNARDAGGEGNHPDTGTVFAGPSHPLLP